MAQCRYCQAVVNEYGELGQMIQNLPPAVSPSPGLEERTVAAMVRAIADQRPTRTTQPSAASHLSATSASQKPPRSIRLPVTPPPSQPGEKPADVIPVRRRPSRRVLTIGAAAAAVIIAAIVVPLALGGPAPITVVIPLMPAATADALGERCWRQEQRTRLGRLDLRSQRTWPKSPFAATTFTSAGGPLLPAPTFIPSWSVAAPSS